MPRRPQVTRAPFIVDGSRVPRRADHAAMKVSGFSRTGTRGPTGAAPLPKGENSFAWRWLIARSRFHGNVVCDASHSVKPLFVVHHIFSGAGLFGRTNRTGAAQTSSTLRMAGAL